MEHDRYQPLDRLSRFRRAGGRTLRRRRPLALWRDDAVEMIGPPIESERGTYVKSKIRCRLLQDFAGRNGYPRAIDILLVVAIDLSP